MAGGWWLWAHATWRHLECPFAVQYAFDMGSYIPSFFLFSSHTIIIGFEIEIKSPIFTDSDRSLIKKFEFELININFFTPNVRPPHLSLSIEASFSLFLLLYLFNSIYLKSININQFTSLMSVNIN